ncbi:hypothetical protein BDV23DRAFT_108088 [Aspergillus alliaceus]|uniref:Uncharacterized protein n=1 Tax=Petromyces alliaceus TaxID=209559 RepID=A0A5N7C4K0_PETAA|nr:hypothetical protein BDV23DRAFT_108088 [Aspergillus alliaceus]
MALIPYFIRFPLPACYILLFRLADCLILLFTLIGVFLDATTSRSETLRGLRTDERNRGLLLSVVVYFLFFSLSLKPPLLLRLRNRSVFVLHFIFISFVVWQDNSKNLTSLGQTIRIVEIDEKPNFPDIIGHASSIPKFI